MQNNLLLILQIITGVGFTGLVLLQVKGTGFGRVWGFTNNVSRRGLEGFVFKLTFVVGAIFLLLSMLTIL